MTTPLFTKPPYRVPLLSEVEAVPSNGFRIVSTFSGCGGSCLGFRMAGFKTLMASEFVPAARETYAANHPGVPVDDRDIRLLSVEDVLARTGLVAGELDVLEGSPPCASFSTAGKGKKGWGEVRSYSDVKQRTDDLFFEYARLLRGLLPKVFVAENVSGLVKGAAKGYFKQILAELKGCGYVVEARVLDAQWLGVPQARQRVIFVGVRGDLGLPPAFPSPLPYRYSIRDALPELTSIAAPRQAEQFPEARGVFNVDRPALTVSAVGMSVFGPHQVVVTSKGHGFFKGGEIDIERPAPTVTTTPDSAAYYGHGVAVAVPPQDVSIERFAIGPEWKKLRPGEASEKYFNLVRPDPDLPVPTVTQAGGTMGAASVTHPHEPRKFTIAELRRLCAFPDDFVLTGTYKQQWERLGRSVPPLMMRAVAEVVRDKILRRLP